MKFNGRDVVVQPDQPKMQVSKNFAALQDQDLVMRTNAWMREFFGMTNIIPDGKVIYADQSKWGLGTGAGSYYVNPRTYEKLATIK